MRFESSPTRCAGAWLDIQFTRFHCLDACMYELDKKIRMIVFDELGAALIATSAIDGFGREHAEGTKLSSGLESDRPPFRPAAANKISPIQAEVMAKRWETEDLPPFYFGSPDRVESVPGVVTGTSNNIFALFSRLCRGRVVTIVVSDVGDCTALAKDSDSLTSVIVTPRKIASLPVTIKKPPS